MCHLQLDTFSEGETVFLKKNIQLLICATWSFMFQLQLDTFLHGDTGYFTKNSYFRLHFAEDILQVWSPRYI